MITSLKAKIAIYLIAFVTAVLGITIFVISWQLQQRAEDQANRLSREIFQKAYTTINSYHSISKSILNSHIETINNLKDALDQNSAIAPQLLRQQHESIVEFMESFTKSGKNEFGLIFNNDGMLQALGVGGSGYKPGDTSIPRNIASYGKLPVLQHVYDLLQKEIRLEISPSEARDQEAASKFAGFVLLTPDFLKALKVDDQVYHEKGAIAIVACGIIRDEFAFPLGISFVGKFISDLEHVFQEFTDVTDVMTSLYIGGTPIASIGFKGHSQKTIGLADLEIDVTDMLRIYASDAPTHITFTYPEDRFFSTCSPINDIASNDIGILCSGMPGAYIKDIQEPALDQAKRIRSTLQTWLIVVGGVMISVTFFISFFFARQLTKPIDRMIALTDKVGKGDLDSRLNVQATDEMGILAQAFDAMLDKLAITLQERKRLEAQLQFSRKMEAIGTLAGGVAHDLNNILSGIVSYPDMILAQLPNGSHLKKPITTIKDSGLKAAAIVQDLLTLARRGVSVTEVLNLNTIISNYFESPEYEKLISYHPQVVVDLNLDADLLNCMGSKIHLSKTIMNLVSNAAEAMPEGGELSVGTENRYIDKSIQGYDGIKEGDYVVVRVRDTGVGMTAEEKERIFEPFFTKKTMGRSGTGLGMAVVWGTVKDHHGYIHIESAPGKGTLFELYFKATRDALPEQEDPFDIGAIQGKGESILVVDDIKEQREIASDLLSMLGYTVHAVETGAEAVAFVREQGVDLLVLDMIMEPGWDGLDTYRKILELRPDQKAIIASGFSETSRVKSTLELGAGAYIRKPYTLAQLGTVIKKVL